MVKGQGHEAIGGVGLVLLLLLLFVKHGARDEGGGRGEGEDGRSSWFPCPGHFVWTADVRSQARQREVGRPACPHAAGRPGESGSEDDRRDRLSFVLCYGARP